MRRRQGTRLSVSFWDCEEQRRQNSNQQPKKRFDMLGARRGRRKGVPGDSLNRRYIIDPRIWMGNPSRASDLEERKRRLKPHKARLETAATRFKSDEDPWLKLTQNQPSPFFRSTSKSSLPENGRLSTASPTHRRGRAHTRLPSRSARSGRYPTEIQGY
ncbi:hypothetical protein N665_0718s0006 [Sinapis alba]|nr:hypothetical protein N665_0718s0006 [Sinapis alba]